MWSTLKNIPKFTKKSELDAMIGKPKFQIEDCPAYYYGGGIVVHFSPKCFRIEGIQRVEYGNVDEYAVGLYHFSDVGALMTFLGLDSFPVNDVVPLEEDILDGVITTTTNRCKRGRKEVKCKRVKNDGGERKRLQPRVVPIARTG